MGDNKEITFFNCTWAFLSYLFFFFGIVPLLAWLFNRRNNFVKLHAKQAASLFFLWLAFNLFLAPLKMVFKGSLMGVFLTKLSLMAGLFFFGLWMIGMVFSWKGKEKIPLIGELIHWRYSIKLIIALLFVGVIWVFAVFAWEGWDLGPLHLRLLPQGIKEVKNALGMNTYPEIPPLPPLVNSFKLLEVKKDCFYEKLSEYELDRATLIIQAEINKSNPEYQRYGASYAVICNTYADESGTDGFLLSENSGYTKPPNILVMNVSIPINGNYDKVMKVCCENYCDTKEIEYHC